MVSEMAEGIFRIESVFGGRLLYLYLLCGERATVLVDSGASVTPEEAIFPALKSLKRVPDLLLVTHPDLDHQGGNARLHRAYPEMTLACGAGDRDEIADPHALVAHRYGRFEHDHGVGFPTDVKPRLVHLAGEKPVPVDRVFCGGERIALSDDWAVELLHLPGHSHGHLGVFDPRSRIAITQDAVHGRGYPFADGRPWALMPTYYYVEPYLDTVERLRGLELSALHTAHWPEAEGAGVDERLDETVAYTLEADRNVFDLISKGASTLRELMDRALPLLGKWDPSVAGDFACSVYGHVERLVDAGLVEAERREGLMHYRAINDYEPPRERRGALRQ